MASECGRLLGPLGYNEGVLYQKAHTEGERKGRLRGVREKPMGRKEVEGGETVTLRNCVVGYLLETVCSCRWLAFQGVQAWMPRFSAPEAYF